MAKLTGISVPGLSARVLRERAPELPNLTRLFAATVVVLDGASPQQLEASLITGQLPEFHNRATPLWEGVPASVQTEFALREEWLAIADQRQLTWQTLALDLPALDAAVGDQTPLAVLSACARVNDQPVPQDADPLDRPVLLTRGIDQPKNCVGILEIAGILRRALRGEKLTDAL